MERLRSLARGTVVSCQWEDSGSIHGWHNHWEGLTGAFIRSAGYVVDNTEDGLILTTSLNDQDGCICPLLVPWTCITHLEVIA